MHLLRSLRSTALCALAFVGAALQPVNAKASDPFLVVPDPATVETTAAYRYANMTNDEAIAELNRRGLPYVSVDSVPGVRAPVRLTGRLHGVLIHTAQPPNQRATSPFEILDARLALALDDFTVMLEKHDIDEIEHFSMYRPNVAKEIKVPPQEPVKAPPKTNEKAREVEMSPQGEVAPAKPSEPVVRPVANKPTTARVAARSKTNAPHKPRKMHAKSAPVKTRAAASAPNKESIAANPTPVAPAPKVDKPVEIVTVPLPPVDHAGLRVASVVVPSKQQENHAPKMQPNPAWAPPGTRHPGGLAIDVGKLRKKDGTWISLLTHFHGKIGAKACGADAPVPESAEARELRTLVCDAMDHHLFTYVLTPNYNAAHADHFHIEIKPGVKWFLVH